MRSSLRSSFVSPVWLLKLGPAAMRPIHLLLIPFFLCASAALGDWTPLAPGVDYREFTGAHVDVHVARVDLTNPEVMVVSTPESQPGTTDRDYADRNKALVALHAAYFDAKCN